MNRTAELSPCGTYRYRLDRIWDEDLNTACFVMLNPSTADAEQDDPTIRKCIGFAKRWGFGGIRVVNLWPYRAKDPKALKAAIRAWRDRRADRTSCDPTGGMQGLQYLEDAAAHTSRLVVAWGVHAAIDPARVGVLASVLRRPNHLTTRELWCLGTTKDGSPRHPLMLAYDTLLERWVGPWRAAEEATS